MTDFARERARLIIADDEPAVRKLLVELLAGENFNVVGVAGDGVEAIGLAERLQADAFVLDVRMPNMGGIEAARAIRAGSPDARLVVFSAYEDATLQEDAVAAGVDTCLVKGCPFGDLLVALRG